MGLLSRLNNLAGEPPIPVSATGVADQESSGSRESAPIELDEMGKALTERLGRLPEKKSTPYTALSLLKAYEDFQAGVCLSLENGKYSSYATVGFGIEQFSIPQEELWSEASAVDKHFRLYSPKCFEEKSSKKDLVYWAFPLDSGVFSADTTTPWTALMVLGASNSSRFSPDLISAILDEVADKMVLPKVQDPSEPSSGEPSSGEPDSGESFSIKPDSGELDYTELSSTEQCSSEPGSVESYSVELDSDELDLIEFDPVEPASVEPGSEEDDIVELISLDADSDETTPDCDKPEDLEALESLDSEESGTVKKEIFQFHQTHLGFNCIVLENPPAQPDFREKVSEIINTAGTVVSLSSERLLIMLPKALDRDLIAHRLSKTLNTRILLTFEASNPENAIVRIDVLM